jgi:hypothetical protein
MVGHHRRRCNGLILSVILPILLATTAGGLFGFGPLVPASASSPKGSSGSFTFSGQFSGTLKVPAFLPPDQITAGCEVTIHAGIAVIEFPTAKIKVSGKTTTIHNVDMQVDVSKFGHTYPMTIDSSGAALGSVSISYGSSNWMTRSGSITTTARGKSGSVNGTLSTGTNPSTTATIKGSWSGCARVVLG